VKWTKEAAIAHRERVDERANRKADVEKRDWAEHKHARKLKRTKSMLGEVSKGIFVNPVNPKTAENQVQVLLGTPTLGTVRIEWHNMMKGMVSPPNWSLITSTPTGYTVPDAQNMLVDTMLRGNLRALLLIEDDTCPPPHAILTFDRWFWKMERRLAPPVVSGLYHIKGSAEVRNGKKGGVELLGPEPLAYRGSGQRAYRDWKMGDVIWVSGVPTGALLLHRSILEAWAKEPDVEEYAVPGYPHVMKRIFQQPSHVWVDPETKGVHVASGTSDLWWSEQTIKRGLLEKAGWKKYAKKEFPYIIDTGMHFKHIDRATGMMY
jgi:hypothetical protein